MKVTAIGTLIRRAYSGAPWIAGATPGSKQLNILPRAGSALRASAHAIWFRGSHHCSEPRSYCGTPAQREDSPNPQQSAPPIRFLVVRHAYKLELMAYPNRRSIASSRIPPHPHPLARIFLRRASLIEQGPWHRFHIRPQEHLYHRRRAGTNKTTCDAPSLLAGCRNYSGLDLRRIGRCGVKIACVQSVHPPQLRPRTRCCQPFVIRKVRPVPNENNFSQLITPSWRYSAVNSNVNWPAASA